MELPTYFDEFRTKTQPTDRQRTVMIDEHRKLREGLAQAPELKQILLGTFIQGSQRRATSNRGSADHPCDVDVVAVTSLPRSKFTAEHAHRLFQPFLERNYSGKFESQERAWCIKVDREVTIDLVPTAEPDSPQLAEAMRKDRTLIDWAPTFQSLSEAVESEARQTKEWDRTSPLWIPDRKLKTWEQTHPLHLIAWTARKNAACNGYFTHVVKAIKWWKRDMQPSPKYPKGYPLEHLLADCCPEGLTSTAEGIVRTLERVAADFRGHAARKETPFLQARGIAEQQNVMKRVLGEDFAGFHVHVEAAARLARTALDSKDTRESAALWRKLLGPEFPPAPEPVPVRSTFTPREQPTRLTEGRYA